MKNLIETNSDPEIFTKGYISKIMCNGLPLGLPNLIRVDNIEHISQ